MGSDRGSDWLLTGGLGSTPVFFPTSASVTEFGTACCCQCLPSFWSLTVSWCSSLTPALLEFCFSYPHLFQQPLSWKLLGPAGSWRSHQVQQQLGGGGEIRGPGMTVALAGSHMSRARLLNSFPISDPTLGHEHADDRGAATIRWATRLLLILQSSLMLSRSWILFHRPFLLQ